MKKNTIDVNMMINGEEKTLTVEPHVSLLRALRDNMYWDVKCGCEEGDCGTCTVLLNGKAVKSCITLAASCEGAVVWTNYGLGEHDDLTQKIQAAFVECGSIQCGFCTPGMIVAAKHYLEHGGIADEAQIRKAISGNLCRCTGYNKIVDAIYKVAKEIGREVR